jgi:hypothetical protein
MNGNWVASISEFGQTPEGSAEFVEFGITDLIILDVDSSNSSTPEGGVSSLINDIAEVGPYGACTQALAKASGLRGGFIPVVDSYTNPSGLGFFFRALALASGLLISLYLMVKSIEVYSLSVVQLALENQEFGEFSLLRHLSSNLIGFNHVPLVEVMPTSNNSQILSFFNPAWSTDLFTLTDIQSLGFILYLGYPVAIVLLGMILWIVLIGILCISSGL